MPFSPKIWTRLVVPRLETEASIVVVVARMLLAFSDMQLVHLVDCAVLVSSYSGLPYDFPFPKCGGP